MMKSRILKTEGQQVNKIEFLNISRGLCNFKIQNSLSPQQLPRTLSLLKRMSTETIQTKQYDSPTSAVKRKITQYEITLEHKDKVILDNKQELRVLSTSSQGKIPCMPITLMNSSMRNKRIQIQMLLRQQQTVQAFLKKQKEEGQLLQKKIQLSFSGARFEQEQAVRELLNKFGDQLNLRSVKGSQKRKQAELIKEMYTKDLFIKNQFQNHQIKILRKIVTPSQQRHLDHHEQQYRNLKCQTQDSEFSKQGYTQNSSPLNLNFHGSQRTFSQRNIDLPQQLDQILPSQHKKIDLINHPNPQKKTYCQHLQRLQIQNKNRQIQHQKFVNLNTQENLSNNIDDDLHDNIDKTLTYNDQKINIHQYFDQNIDENQKEQIQIACLKKEDYLKF